MHKQAHRIVRSSVILLLPYKQCLSRSTDYWADDTIRD